MCNWFVDCLKVQCYCSDWVGKYCAPEWPES